MADLHHRHLSSSGWYIIRPYRPYRSGQTKQQPNSGQTSQVKQTRPGVRSDQVRPDQTNTSKSRLTRHLSSYRTSAGTRPDQTKRRHRSSSGHRRRLGRTVVPSYRPSSYRRRTVVLSGRRTVHHPYIIIDRTVVRTYRTVRTVRPSRHCPYAVRTRRTRRRQVKPSADADVLSYCRGRRPPTPYSDQTSNRGRQTKQTSTSRSPCARRRRR